MVKRAFLFAACLLTVPFDTLGASPSVVAHDGRLEYHTPDRKVTVLATDRDIVSPVLSPDRRTVAFVRVLKPATPDGEGESELWIADGISGRARRLLGSKPSERPERNLRDYARPVFSVSGKSIYFGAPAWGTDWAVHRIYVATERERFVAAGELLSVIRNGPYRGHLLVRKHTSLPAPETEGYYYPAYVVRSDGEVRFRVPGMEHDDDERHVSEWLAQHHWVAW